MSLSDTPKNPTLQKDLIEGLKMKSRFTCLAAGILILTTTVAQSEVLDAVLLGPLQGQVGHYQPMPIVTQDGSRTILIGSQGSRVQAFVDGIAGPVVNEIPIQRPVKTPITGTLRGSPVISADQQRVAYIVGLDNGKKAVVIDGTQSPAYDAVSWLGFAPAGHRFAYIAKRGNEEFCVDDGKAGLMYQNVFADNSAFSPDGAHFAYTTVAAPGGNAPPVVAVQGGNQNLSQPQCYVLDGIEQKKFGNLGKPLFSRDGKHFAYIAGVDGFTPSRVVVDGREGTAYPYVENLVLSDNGVRVVYTARKGGQQGAKNVVVDNGTEGTDYAMIQNLVVSPDGKRVAYSATRTSAPGQYFVVENGQAGRQYQFVEFVLVSPDSQTLIYGARAQQGQFLVANGQESGPFTQVVERPVFGDGGHWAAAVSLPAGGNAIVQDGRTIPLNPAITPTGLSFQPGTGRLLLTSRNSYTGAPVMIEVANMPAAGQPIPSEVAYSPNRQHTIKVFTANAGSSQTKVTAALDDKPIPDGNWAIVSKPCVSDDGRHYAFIAGHPQGGGAAGLHVVFDGQEGPGYPVIDNVSLTPDGRHVAYVAEDAINKMGGWFVVLDGSAGPAFQDVFPTTPFQEGESRLRFSPDGSLHFLAAMAGQLYRCRYPAGVFAGLPGLAAVEGERPGPKEMCRIEGPGLTHIQFVIAPDDTIYGITIGTGKFRKGSLYKIKADGSDYAMLKDFYGGDDDGENPSSLILAKDGRAVIGTFGFKIFKYDLQTKDYTVTEVSKRDPVFSFAGYMADGSLIGFSGGAGPGDKPYLFSMSPDGSNYKTYPNNPNIAPNRVISRIVPARDGSFFAIGRDKGFAVLLRFNSPGEVPTVVHKFKNSPDDGGNPEANLVMDSAGNLYGSTSNGGNSQQGIFYRLSADGSKYEAIYNPDQMDFPHLFAVADDGTLYGLDDKGLHKVSPGAAKAETVMEFKVDANFNGQSQIAFHHNALLYRSNKIIYKIALPSAGGATTGAGGRAAAAPSVTINKSPPRPVPSEPIAFTGPSGAGQSGMATKESPPAQQQPPAPQPTQKKAEDSVKKAEDGLNKANDIANKAKSTVKKIKGLFGN